MDAGAIKEIKRRAEAATPGPWYAHNIDDDLCMNLYAVTTSETEPDYDEIVGIHDGDVVAVTLLQSPRVASVRDWKFRENTEFIAAANPTATLSLIAHVERLQRENEILRDYHSRDTLAMAEDRIAQEV